MKSLYQIIVVMFLALFVVGCSDSNERKIPKVEVKVQPEALTKKESKESTNKTEKNKKTHADKMLEGAGIDVDMSLSEIMERSKNIKEDAVAF